jgi:DNA helicase II / ATP-dependent DNA helicase PcrA
MVRAEALLSRLDPEQREVAEATRGPVCVLAGAGTGKTRAITYRIAYAVQTGVIAPQRVLAVTFTTRAAGELRARLRDLGAAGAQARTFHSAAYKQLAYFWPKVVGGDPPRLIESKFALVAEAAKACHLSLGRTELRDAASEVEWAKVTQTRPEDYAAAAAKARRSPPAEPDDMARLYGAYESLRRDRNLLDFEGMLELTAAIFTEHQEVARQFRDQYRFFVVDEYQDVNPLQKLLLDGWLGDREELCVVGDPNQTIYSFAGATPSYLLSFAVEHPEAKVVRLVRDYRSTPQVVHLANGVLGGQHRLVAQRSAGPEPTFHEHDDEVAEAEAVARRARALIDAGVPTREIAVLFRVNAQTEIYERAFADAGLPYIVRGADRFFERAEVRQAVVLLRGAARSPGGEPLVRAVRDVLASAGLSERPPEGRGAARERWESLAALAQLADDVAADRPDAGLPEFVTELEERAAAQHAPALEGVTLATLHAAKGLEWDAVFLAGLVDGTLPIVYAESSPEQVEEERRLFYVGVTRAREHLSLSWALARSPGGRRGRRRTRFLDGLAPGSGRPPRVERRGAPARGPQPCRICGRRLTAAIERKLGRCETCPAEFDEDLLARLKEWRAATARAQKVPAYVVFTDATLQALAERVPDSEADLAAIPGVGAVKLERYGPAVLALCRREETT